jgi:hypothetical protein
LSAKKKIDFIKTLNSDEASYVLRKLLENKPELISVAHEIAMKAASNIDVDEIMEDVFYELDALDVDDLYSRSGKQRHGYKEPYDEAWEMFVEAIQPFIDEMNKNHICGLVSVSKTYCIGIVKGLLKYENDSFSEFKDWATDAPLEYIDRILDEWKKNVICEDEINDVKLAVDNLRNDSLGS